MCNIFPDDVDEGKHFGLITQQSIPLLRNFVLSANFFPDRAIKCIHLDLALK